MGIGGQGVVLLRVMVVMLAWIALVSSGQAQAQSRLALVVGNESYSGALTKLNRPYQDADQIGGALGTAGFSVTKKKDQGRGDILKEVRALADRLKQAGPDAVGFFYYSGHGASALVGDKRRNYVIPTGTSVAGPDDLVAEGIALDDIIAILQRSNARAIFVVFDACRSELPWSRGGADPDKAFNAVAAGPGMFIAYSTAEGTSAPDDGAFASNLAAQLVVPGRTHLVAFDAAARAVGRARGADRKPWYSNQIDDDIFFVTGAASRPAAPTQPPAIAPAQSFPASPPPAPSFLDARSTPSTTRAPLVSVDPKTLPDFALFRECEGCPDMVVLPGNTFTMGSDDGGSAEKPPRQVSIRRFAISRFETTWDEWDACVAAGACNAVGPQGQGGDQGWGKGRRPVIEVDWNDAHAFAGFATRRSRATYRLPSEAEWEYAARGGTTGAYPWGASPSHDYANYGKDTCCDGLASGRDAWVNTAPVGAFPGNAFGLFDLHGNVLEWVEDCYEDSYLAGQLSDGTAFTRGSCSLRVIRGGSWVSHPAGLRSALRYFYPPTVRGGVLGFRLARTL